MSTAADIARAAELLRAGRLVVFPTETVYGLGANALDAAAVAKIYAVKGRPATSPLIVHVASVDMAKSLAAEWPETADLLTQKFWPGPLTVVVKKAVKKQPAIPDIVTAGLNTVGLRMPAHPVALSLIRAAGIPLAAPSANRFTEISPTTADHVRRGLGNNVDVDLILDGGPCNIGIESTVISLAGEQPTLLRPGGISRAQLEAVIGPISSAQGNDQRGNDQTGDDQRDDVHREDGATGVPASPAVTSLMERRASPPVQPLVIGEDIAHPSPGMHARHYSPRTPLFLIRPGKIRDEKIRDGKLPKKGKGIYLRLGAPFKPAFGLSGDSLTEDILSRNVERQPASRTDSAFRADITVIQMPHSAADYAAALYDKLHQADQAGVDWIAVDLPPNAPEWEAVNDRLRRAASKG